MDGGNDGDAKRRTGGDSEKDAAAAAARVDPSKVKKEKLSGAGEQGVPKRRAEEGIQLTAAVAASQKGAVADKAVRLGTEKPRDADAESDSYSDNSDPSVTPARGAGSPCSSGEHYEPYHFWSEEEDDRRGHKARSRWHTTRSRSGGNGQGGRPIRRDASTTDNLLAWKSGRRSDAFAERGSCRRPKRRNPGSPVSDPSGGERSQRGGGKDNTRSRGCNPLPRRPPPPPPCAALPQCPSTHQEL